LLLFQVIIKLLRISLMLIAETLLLRVNSLVLLALLDYRTFSVISTLVHLARSLSLMPRLHFTVLMTETKP